MLVPMLTMLLGHHYFSFHRSGWDLSQLELHLGVAPQRVFLNTLSDPGQYDGEASQCNENVTVAVQGRMDVVPRAWC